ncbi:hypothetical protein BDB01DRAFT_775896 [Pilobolus umbonatus]|nr:hypothetical protein BDB01DRAFT_775896 [Pilobolus umbonatus]
MKISRNLAICMFFYVDYTEENVKKYNNRLEDFGNVEICYNIEPNQPILVSMERIRNDPESYHLYSDNTSVDEEETDNVIHAL